MRRREFIAFVGAAAAWPPAALAQQPVRPLVGFLNSASAASYAEFAAAFRAGLSETGFVEGQNVSIAYRWADGDYQRLPALAADLTQLRLDVIVANGPAAPVAMRAGAAVPMVFTAGFDPIELGLVTNLKRPGGNVTGVSILNVELGPKRLELLREVLPGAASMALLVNPSNPNVATQTRDLQAAARRLAVELHVLHARTDREVITGFAALAERGASALLIGTDPFFTTRSELLAGLALRHAMPAVYQYRDFVAAGGLMSYGSSLSDAYRRAGVYVGRILKGEKPADLPVQQSTKVELMINLGTARALGLELPPSLVARADEVIE